MCKTIQTTYNYNNYIAYECGTTLAGVISSGQEISFQMVLSGYDRYDATFSNCDRYFCENVINKLCNNIIYSNFDTKMYLLTDDLSDITSTSNNNCNGMSKTIISYIAL